MMAITEERYTLFPDLEKKIDDEAKRVFKIGVSTNELQYMRGYQAGLERALQIAKGVRATDAHDQIAAHFGWEETATDKS